MESAFGIVHTVAKSYLGPKGWRPVLQASSLDRKIARRANWHRRGDIPEAQLSNRKIPTKGYIEGVGQVRVGEQKGKKHFVVYDNKDQKRLVNRNRLGFRK